MTVHVDPTMPASEIRVAYLRRQDKFWDGGVQVLPTGEIVAGPNWRAYFLKTTLKA